jgi:hypothetical protein
MIMFKSNCILASGALAILALIASFIAVWPPLQLVLINANLPTFYQENIGWHFFWTQRFLDRVPGDYIHPGQGVLFTLIQALYILIGRLLKYDLYDQIHLFGHLTIVVAAIAMMLLVVIIAFDRTLDVAVRAALVVTPLVMSVGGPIVFVYNEYPDYLAYTKVLFLLFGWRWLHHRAWEGIATSRAAVELGILVGLLAAFKVTYPLWAAGLLLISIAVMVPVDLRAAVHKASILVGAAAASMVACFLIFYYGNPWSMVKFFTSLLRWGVTQSGTWSFSLDPFVNFANNEASLARTALLTVILCAFRLLGLSWKSSVFSAVVLALVAYAVATCYWRGGGSSYFDAVMMVSVLCVLAAATFQRRQVVRLASFAVAAAFIAWPATWVFAHWHEYKTVTVYKGLSLLKLADVGDWQRGLYNWNVSRGLPLYVLMPTNREAQGTIEDMIYAGFQNFAGAPTDVLRNLKTLYPHITFLYFDSVGYRLALPPRRLVFMYAKGKPLLPFPQIDDKSFEDHARQVERLLKDRRQEECYKVTHMFSRVEVISCVLSAPE